MSLSVPSKSSIETDEQIELVFFGTGVFLPVLCCFKEIAVCQK